MYKIKPETIVTTIYKNNDNDDSNKHNSNINNYNRSLNINNINDK